MEMTTRFRGLPLTVRSYTDRIEAIIVSSETYLSLEVIRAVPRLSTVKMKSMRVTAYAYAAWCVFWLVAAAMAGGEIQKGAHPLLAMTGMPMALVSLYMQHGSLAASSVAAVLGLVQWVVVAAWIGGDPPVRLSTPGDEE